MLIDLITGHPLIILGVLLLAYQMYQRSKPFPEIEGSKVKSVSTPEQLKTICSELGNGYVIVDFYATWCPPCRAAAPVFAEWSKKYDPKHFTFAKVNVDKAREVARQHGISAMPTFKVLDRTGAEVVSFVGWRRSAIENFISQKSK